MQPGDWPALIALLLLIPVMAISIVPNNQTFNAYLVWGDQPFDLTFMGTKLPTTWLVTLNAIVSVSFLAGVALLYRWYGNHWKDPDELGKSILGPMFSIGRHPCLVWAPATQGQGGTRGTLVPVILPT